MVSLQRFQRAPQGTKVKTLDPKDPFLIRPMEGLNNGDSAQNRISNLVLWYSRFS
jgi:hypothetical protein